MSTIIPFPAGRISRCPRARPIEDCISKVRDAIRILEDHAEPRYRRRTRDGRPNGRGLVRGSSGGDRGIQARPPSAAVQVPQRALNPGEFPPSSPRESPVRWAFFVREPAQPHQPLASTNTGLMPQAMLTGPIGLYPGGVTNGGTAGT